VEGASAPNEQDRVSCEAQENDTLEGDLSSAILTAWVPQLAKSAFEDTQLKQRIVDTLAIKPKSRKNDYKKKAEEYLTLIKSLRGCLTTLVKQTDQFVEMMVHLEKKNIDRNSQLVCRCKQYHQENFQLENDLSAVRASYAEETVKRKQYEEEITALMDIDCQKNQQISELDNELCTVNERLDEYTAELEMSNQRAEQTQQEIVAAQELCASLEKVHNKQLSEIKESTAKELRELQTLLEEYKGKLQVKEEAFLTMKDDLMARDSELQKEKLRTEFDKRQADLSLDHQCQLVKSLQGDLQLARDQLKEKSIEYTLLLQNLNESNQSSRTREEALTAGKILADEKTAKLEATVAKLSEDNTKLQLDCASAFNELCAAKEALETSRKTCAAHQDAEKRLSEDVIKARQELEVEKVLRHRAEERESEERREKSSACNQLMATELGYKIETERLYKEKCDQEKMFQDQLGVKANELIRMTGALAFAREAETGLKAENTSLKQALEEFANKTVVSSDQMEQMAKMSGELEVIRRRYHELQKRYDEREFGSSTHIQELEEQVKTLEAARRNLHNLVQELRGNVRVLVRVRPFLPEDGQEKDPSKPNNQWGITKFHPDGSTLSVEQEVSRIGQTGEIKQTDTVPFTFDKVLAPCVSQEGVFSEVRDLVQSALDGFNVCIFCYGQTGSGKTHTMQGARSGPMRGVIPRAIQQIGEAKASLEEKGWTYNMEATFLEIYNDQIRDLMIDESLADTMQHEIKKDKDGQLYVAGLKRVAIDPNDSDLIESLMETANRHRASAQTCMNVRSSRSHSVFTLHLQARNEQLQAEFEGKLHLVDLAGSERLSRSGATGQRLKETQAINSSLSCLSDVFQSISHQNSHIPFRNSKLTYLLQPALSGDGKTLMIVNLSPTTESYNESLCSLRFASKVNQCELGRPKKQVRQTLSSRKKEL